MNSSPVWDGFPELTAAIEVLEGFQDFQANTRAAAFRLYGSELAVQQGWQQETAEFHLRVIALHAGLGGKG